MKAIAQVHTKGTTSERKHHYMWRVETVDKALTLLRERKGNNLFSVEHGKVSERERKLYYAMK